MGTIDNLPTFEDDFNSYTVELKEGQFLGENKNYRLEKNLDAGGMGEVWLATEIRNRQEIRKVVVKTIRPDRRDNEGAQEKALKQFRLIQSLNHQNICPIYVIEHDPACGYLIVMGYADGGSYADWFAEKPKSLAEVCDVLRPIADALDFAHKFGVIHRDVKPENMMFTQLNGIRVSWLIDFGIAANLRTATKATQGQFSQSGTESYMAPEQKTRQLQTGQTDEYSLAMVALEFLTGSLSPLSALLLSPEIQPIVVKALAPEPSARYATCRAFIDALASAGTTFPASSIRKDGSSPSAAGPAASPSHTKTNTGTKPPASLIRKNGGSPSTAVPSANVGPVNTGTMLPASSKKAGERKILTADGIDYAFRWCPPGVFMMGRDSRLNHSKPVHQVKLTKGFWLLETQVTQAMWQSVMGNNPSKFKGERNPVEYVSWEDCQSFCKKLSQKLGQRVQLPTEAQWEYACRAGTTGSYAGNLDEMAWYISNSDLTTHAVGQKKPNAWGLYDMHGNVWEWCSDYYDSTYYSRSPKSDPENTTASPYRVSRGGSFNYLSVSCLPAYRHRGTPNDRDCHFGFRLLVVPSPED